MGRDFMPPIRCLKNRIRSTMGQQTQTVREDLTGATVGRYLVIRRLGAGGMGEVYLAEDSKLKRTVALKRMGARLRSDERVAGSSFAHTGRVRRCQGGRDAAQGSRLAERGAGHFFQCDVQSLDEVERAVATAHDAIGHRPQLGQAEAVPVDTQHPHLCAILSERHPRRTVLGCAALRSRGCAAVRSSRNPDARIASP